MKKTAQIMLILMGLALTFPSSGAIAQTFNVQLLANKSVLDGEFNALIHMEDSTITTGVTGVYKDDHYRYLNGKLSIGNEIITPGLTADLGIYANAGRLRKTDRKGNLVSW